MVKKFWPAVVPKAANVCLSLRNWQSLRRRADFLQIQKQGRKWITPAFVIQMTALSDSAFPATEKGSLNGTAFATDSRPEIGFTATKRLGNAVIRNRCRRRLRAVCDQVVGEFALSGHKTVLIARDEAETRPFEQLVRDLRWALRRLDIPAHEKAKPDQNSKKPA